MRTVKEEYRHLDYVFAHEEQITDSDRLRIIATSYETARGQNPLAAQVASRRYRTKEHRFKTCRELFISEPQYYKVLSVFLKIAKELAQKEKGKLLQ